MRLFGRQIPFHPLYQRCQKINQPIFILFLRPKKQTLPSCPGYQTQEPSKALQNIQEIPGKREYIIFSKSKIYVVV